MKKSRRERERGRKKTTLAIPSRFYTLALRVIVISSFPSYSSRTPLCSTTIFHQVPALRRRTRGGEQTGGGETGYSLISIFRSFASGPSHPICTRLRVQRPLCVYVLQRGSGRRRKEEERLDASRSISATRANYYWTRSRVCESVEGRGEVSK